MTAYMDHKDLANYHISPDRARQIADAAREVMEQIADAEREAGRRAGSVTLLAATKTRDVGEIMAALDAGIALIGENRPQEVTAKISGLRRLCAERGWSIGTGSRDGGVGGVNDEVDEIGINGGVNGNDGDAGNGGAVGSGVVTASHESGLTSVGSVDTRETPATGRHIDFHLIGQLQSNKIGKVLPVVDTIESVGSMALAEKISRRAVAHAVSVGVLVEVNESGEPAKSGCNPKNALDIARRIGIMGGLDLRGFMTIGAHVDDEIVIRKGFSHLRQLRDQLLESGEPGTDHCLELSMGMTGDMRYAIAEGSTIVRVGTGIFGQRAFI